MPLSRSPPQAATEQAGQDKPVRIANFLCPGNYAVSGSKEGCDAVEKLGKSFGARWVALGVSRLMIGVSFDKRRGA